MHGRGAGAAAPGDAEPGDAAAVNGDAELTLADLDLLEGHHGARALLIPSACLHCRVAGSTLCRRGLHPAPCRPHLSWLVRTSSAGQRVRHQKELCC